MKILVGDRLAADTNADFLNKNFGTDYRAWMRCTYSLTDELDIFFVRLNGIESPLHWINTLTNDSRFVEEYVGSKQERLKSHKYTAFTKKRATFDVQEKNGKRAYVFRGIFEFSNESTTDKRIWNRIADELLF